MLEQLFLQVFLAVLMVHHKYIQYLIFTVCCLCIYTINQIFEEWCLYYLCSHMYKENNLDLKLLQHSDRQKATLVFVGSQDNPGWTRQVWKMPRRWGLHNFSGQPLPGCDCPHGEKDSPYVCSEPLPCQRRKIGI